MKSLKNILFIFALLLPATGAWANADEDDRLPTMVLNGDTVFHIYLREVYIFPELEFKNKKEENFYWKTVRDVKKTLPYAKIAGKLMAETEEHLKTISDKKEQKTYLKAKEKELFGQFEKDLRKMTMSQGRMLIKLIDRECDKTTYEIIKTYRGSFTAFFWQGIARIFGSNLKSEYDVENADKIVERVIILVEAGQL